MQKRILIASALIVLAASWQVARSMECLEDNVIATSAEERGLRR